MSVKERLREVIFIEESEDTFLAVIAARNFARTAGFSQVNAELIATAVSELVTNILRYAGSGEIQIISINDGLYSGIEIISKDKGPGIDDIEKHMEEGFTTTENSAGLGLPSVRRIMDEFEITSRKGEGVTVLVRKWVK